MSEWLFFGGAVVIWDVGNIMMMMNGCSLVGTGGIWDVGNIINDALQGVATRWASYELRVFLYLFLYLCGRNMLRLVVSLGSPASGDHHSNEGKKKES